jgi:hypothetical protein
MLLFGVGIVLVQVCSSQSPPGAFHHSNQFHVEFAKFEVYNAGG